MSGCVLLATESVELCAARGFFIGNVELFTQASDSVVPVFRQRAELIFLYLGGAVAGFLLGESDTALFEFQTFVGDLFAEGVHFEFVLEFFAGQFRAFSAEFGAFGEIGQALEREELCGGVLAGSGLCVGVFQNGLMDVLGEIGLFGSVDGVEFAEGEPLAGGDPGIDPLDASGFGPKALERASGNLDSKSFGTRFGDALDGVVVLAAFDPFGDLVDFLFGETGEGTLFSHKK